MLIEYIDLHILKQLKLEAETEAGGDWTKLAEKLASVFSHSEYINSSFLQVSF